MYALGADAVPKGATAWNAVASQAGSKVVFKDDTDLRQFSDQLKTVVRLALSWDPGDLWDDLLFTVVSNPAKFGVAQSKEHLLAQVVKAASILKCGDPQPEGTVCWNEGSTWSWKAAPDLSKPTRYGFWSGVMCGVIATVLVTQVLKGYRRRKS